MKRVAICAGLLLLGGTLATVFAQEPTSRKSVEHQVGRYTATGIGDGRVVLLDTATGVHYVKAYGSLTGGPYPFE